MNPNTHKLEIPLPIKLIGGLTLLIFIGVIGIYFYHFGGELGDNNSFGTFGDYIGGLLNPILSFFTIVLVIWTIHKQTNELMLSRNENQWSDSIDF